MVNGEYDQLEKRLFDILSVATERMVSVFSDEGKGKRSSEASTMEVEEESLRATKSSSLRKRKLDELESQNPQQNPNHNASSSTSYPIAYKRRLVVPNEAVREIEAVREREAPVRRRKAPVRERPANTPEWLVNLMREENGGDAKLIFRKELTETDLARKQNRLLIPLSQIVDEDFLNEEEMRIIMEHFNKQRDKGVDVILVGSEGQRCELNLRRWDMKSSANYVLVSGWYNATVNNRLRPGHIIRLWSFHSPQRLYFALVPPDPAPAMALAPDPAPVPDPAPALALAPVTAPALAPPPVPVPAPALAPPPVSDPALVPDSAQALALVPAPTQAQAPALVLALASSSANFPKRRRIPLDELDIYEASIEAEEERKRRCANFPKRKRSPRVQVLPPDPASRDSDDDGQSRLEDSDLYKLAMYCEEWVLSNPTAVPCK